MSVPLAEKLRPKNLDEFVGQPHLVGKGKPVRVMLESGHITSMIFWGPPGCGKTTLARLMASYTDAEFIPFSAVTSGVAEIKKIMMQAEEQRTLYQRKIIVFIDEIHRFNKAQQDAFLPFVENGTITLIGATTENPGFEVNAPLISRSQVYILNTLDEKDLKKIVSNAISAYPNVKWSKDAIEHFIKFANGDARTVINAVELAASLTNNVSLKKAEEAIQQKALYYDKKGDYHYDTISAFIKSMRGGDPNATVHYLARMIKAGEDPLFIARRMVIFASEDVGNAQPTALVLATSCMQAVHMIGMPEAKLILAQTATYLATAKKSIASTEAIYAAIDDVENKPLGAIPLHLRNPVNRVVKNAGYGKGHERYVWKAEKEMGHKIKQEYLPENIKHRKYYLPDWK